jgi:hypothetical protein
MVLKDLIKKIAKAILKGELDSLENDIIKKNEEISELKIDLKKCHYPNPKEEYYNNKYPKIDKKYYKQLLGENKSFDVRCFVGNYRNTELPLFEGEEEEIVIDALKWIIENKKYASDKQTSGLVEYWNMSYESLLVNEMDCEDGAILLYDILRKNNILAWKIRVTVGWAINPWNEEAEGHAYVTFYSEKEKKWVALDWCYFPNIDPIEKQPHYRDVSHYGDVWWSFNEEFCWGDAK